MNNLLEFSSLPRERAREKAEAAEVSEKSVRDRSVADVRRLLGILRRRWDQAQSSLHAPPLLLTDVVEGSGEEAVTVERFSSDLMMEHLNQPRRPFRAAADVRTTTPS